MLVPKCSINCGSHGKAVEEGLSQTLASRIFLFLLHISLDRYPIRKRGLALVD